MTYRPSLSHILLAASLAAMLVPACALAATEVGVNAAIRNKVEMKTADEAQMKPAVVREKVHLGDLVASGADSSLQMLLLDHSVFTIGANARMTIDRFVYNPNQGTTDFAASIARGAFRFMSGRLRPSARRNAITTPVASIGIRGTIVQGAVGPAVLDILSGEPGIPKFNGDPTNAVLILLGGPGRGAQGFDKPGAIDITTGGKTFTITHPGQAILLLPGMPPFGPFNLSDSAFQKLLALLTSPPGPGFNEHFAGGVGSVAISSGDILNKGNYNKNNFFPTRGVPGNLNIPTLTADTNIAF